MPRLYNNIIPAGNNYDVRNSCFTNCANFLHSNSTNKFRFINCFIDDVAGSLIKTYNVFSASTNAIQSPFPNICFLNCVSRQFNEDHNKITITSNLSGLPKTLINHFVQNCIFSDRIIYANNLNMPNYGLIKSGEIFLDYRGQYDDYSCTSVGYDYFQVNSSGSTFIFHESPMWSSLGNKSNTNSIDFTNQNHYLTEKNRYDYTHSTQNIYSMQSSDWSFAKSNNYKFPVNFSYTGSADLQKDYCFIPHWKVVNPNYFSSSTPVPTIFYSNFDNTDYYTRFNYEFDESAVITIDPHPELYNAGGTSLTFNIAEFDLSRIDCRDDFTPLQPDPNGVQESVEEIPPPSNRHITTKDSIIKNNILIYPNPADLNTTVEFSLPENTTSALLTIHDINGNIIMHHTVLNNSTDLQKITINTSNLNSGFYIIKLWNDKTGCSITPLTIIKN
jgi:hypothetical protein